MRHLLATLSHTILPSITAEEHHKLWYMGIRSKIWERITFEDQLPPNMDALKLHWLRTLWVIDYWRQAHLNTLVLLPMEWFGWSIEGSDIHVEWDSPQNLQQTRNSVAFLTHGCACKTGCSTGKCKCVKTRRLCGPGCACSKGSECQNKGDSHEGN